MKLTKTIAVVGLLAISSTAANASTFGWGSSWSNYSSSNYGSQMRSQRAASIASSLFNNFAYTIRSNPRSSQQAQNILAQIRNRLAVRSPGGSGSSASVVPLPASGLLLVGALGAFALRRRQKS